MMMHRIDEGGAEWSSADAGPLRQLRGAIRLEDLLQASSPSVYCIVADLFERRVGWGCRGCIAVLCCTVVSCICVLPVLIQEGVRTLTLQLSSSPGVSIVFATHFFTAPLRVSCDPKLCVVVLVLVCIQYNTCAYVCPFSGRRRTCCAPRHWDTWRRCPRRSFPAT